jgi:hypothetical protein
MFDTMFIPSDLETMAPGAELAEVLASLDWESLSEPDLIRILRAQQRQVSHYQAGSYWAMNKIVAAYEGVDVSDGMAFVHAAEGAAAEIGAVLRLTRQSADMETSLALELNRRLPAVWKALSEGAIDMRRARVIVDSTLHLPPAAAQIVVDSVLPDAPLLTTGQLACRIRKLCIDENPGDAKERYETSLRDRRIVTEANVSGTANLLGLDLPPHVVEAIKRRIHKESIRLRRQGDARTMDQLRADIFLGLLRRQNPKLQETADQGVLNLNADIATLAKMSESSGDLAGYGPVIADIVRQIAEHQQHSEWRWTLIDPDTGLPVDGGITRRRPTTGQRRHVQSMYRTCIHPGCRMPAIDCDIDHRIPWAESHVTRTEDLGPLCRHHHVIRHRHGWTYQPLAGSDFQFTSPLGHTYTTSGRSP